MFHSGSYGALLQKMSRLSAGNPYKLDDTISVAI
jgi:hypothetical protein